MSAAASATREKRATNTSAPLAKLLGIQYLRAIAALMVVYFHLIGLIADYSRFLSPARWIDVELLAGGVDIFFVISGFIMVMTSQHVGPGRFLWRRLIRIIPLYWILTLLVAILAIAAPAVFKSTHFAFVDLLRSLLFIPYVNQDQGGKVLPMLVPGWTLNLEMFFYAVFALTLTRALRTYQILLIGLLFYGLVVLRLAGAFHSPLLLFYSDARIPEFLAGACLARLALSGRVKLAPMPALVLLVAGFALLLSGALRFEGIDALIGATVIVFATVCIEYADSLPNLPWLVKLGDASYSMYLTHIFTLGCAREVWKHVQHGEGAAWAWTFAGFSLLAVVIVSLLSFHYIEKPSLRLLKRWGDSWRKRLPAVASAA